LGVRKGVSSVIDKDTAIKILRASAKPICQCSDDNQVFCDKRCEIPEITESDCADIADLIESLSAKAELGEAALKGAQSNETPVCLELEEYEWEYDEDRCGTGCPWMDFCRFAMNWRNRND
jgi:hypothetical protein